MTSIPGVDLIAEGDAEIDHQPFAVMAVEIEIHPDLAAAAQRQEQELVAAGTIGHGCFSLVRPRLNL